MSCLSFVSRLENVSHPASVPGSLFNYISIALSVENMKCPTFQTFFLHKYTSSCWNFQSEHTDLHIDHPFIHSPLFSLFYSTLYNLKTQMIYNLTIQSKQGSLLSLAYYLNLKLLCLCVKV